MVYVSAAIIIAVLWVIFGALSWMVSKVKLPRIRLPHFPQPEETAADRYAARLSKIDSLPLIDDEREILMEQARRQYMEEA